MRRLFLAVLVAPVCLVLAVGAFGIIQSGGVVHLFTREDAGGALAIAVFGYVGVLAVGLPAYFVLHRVGAANIWTAALVGFVAPWFVSLLFAAITIGPLNGLLNEWSYWVAEPGKEMEETALLGLLGIVTAVAFWVVAKRPGER